MPPKVDTLFVIADLGPGGSQRVLDLVSRSLSEDGQRVAIVTFSTPQSDFFHLHENIQRTTIETQAPRGNLLSSLVWNGITIWRLRREIQRQRPHTVCSFIAVTNILTIIACAGLPVRLVASERNDPARQRLNFPWQWLRRLLYRHADVVSANSKAALTTLAAYVPSEKLRLVENPVAGGGTKDATTRENVVLAVGRLVPQKGFDVLVEAWARLRPKDWRLVIVGSGEERDQLFEQGQALGVADTISYLPPTPRIAEHFRSASILAAPSRFEGTSNVVMEACAHGLAVVISDRCGDTASFVVDGASGRVVPAEDASMLAGALGELMSSEATRTQYGLQAQKWLMAVATDRLRGWRDVLTGPSQAR